MRLPQTLQDRNHINRIKKLLLLQFGKHLKRFRKIIQPRYSLDVNEGIKTRKKVIFYKDLAGGICLMTTYFLSIVEPKNIKEAITDEFRVTIIQEEMVEFTRNNYWDLVSRPEDSRYLVSL